MDARARVSLATLALALVAGPVRAADPADCVGFTAGDAAAFLGAPAAQVTRRVDKLGPSAWSCSYSVGKATPGLVFSVRAEADTKKAQRELERYRDNLMVAGDTAPFKDKLPKGAYSDLAGPGLGDEAVWSDVNGSLAVRKGSLTLQFMAPKGKLEQVKAAEAVTKKLGSPSSSAAFRNRPDVS